MNGDQFKAEVIATLGKYFIDNQLLGPFGSYDLMRLINNVKNHSNKFPDEILDHLLEVNIKLDNFDDLFLRRYEYISKYEGYVSMTKKTYLDLLEKKYNFLLSGMENVKSQLDKYNS